MFWCRFCLEIAGYVFLGTLGSGHLVTKWWNMEASKHAGYVFKSGSWYMLGVAPHRGCNRGKWRFISESPTSYVLILVDTGILGRGGTSKAYGILFSSFLCWDVLVYYAVSWMFRGVVLFFCLSALHGEWREAQVQSPWMEHFDLEGFSSRSRIVK